jgi:hypothetical protein
MMGGEMTLESASGACGAFEIKLPADLTTLQ